MATLSHTLSSSPLLSSSTPTPTCLVGGTTTGWYIGTTAHGVVWTAYEAAEVAPMQAAFARHTAKVGTARLASTGEESRAIEADCLRRNGVEVL